MEVASVGGRYTTSLFIVKACQYLKTSTGQAAEPFNCNRILNLLCPFKSDIIRIVLPGDNFLQCARPGDKIQLKVTYTYKDSKVE